MSNPVAVAALEASLADLLLSDSEHDHESEEDNGEGDSDHDHEYSATRGIPEMQPAAKDQSKADGHKESSGSNLRPSQLKRLRLYQEAVRAVEEDHTSERRDAGETQMGAKRECIVEF